MADTALAEIVLQNLSRVCRLSHPNILRVHEIIRRDDVVHVVMDYVQGINLVAVLRRVREMVPFTAPVATFVTSQVCHALDHAHHLRNRDMPLPLVHGALWPPNVLVSFRGEISVTDFGAWVIPTGMHGEEGSLSIRTQFSYRSPEHVNGSTLTAASDIFCVGILLHEMVTGHQLLRGRSLMETLELVENAKIGELDGVPDELRPVLRRCLERDPADRYADPTSLISDLSVAVPRSGSREVRKNLVGFVEAVARAEGISTQPPLVPEPLPPAKSGEIDSGGPSKIDSDAEEGSTRRSRSQLRPPLDLQPLPVAALSPLPGLREDIDEPTGISPTGVTEALVALSKDSTDPGTLEQLLAPEPDEDEPTRIDPIIPGITGPEPLPALGDDDSDRPEGPTDIMPPVDQRVLWESPLKEEDTKPQPLRYSPAPANDDFIEATTEEETLRTATTGSASGEFVSEDEPTVQAPQSTIDARNPLQHTHRSTLDSDDEPTMPSMPEPPVKPPRRLDDEADDEPTLQAAPQPQAQPVWPPPPASSRPVAGPPKNATLPWPALEDVYPTARRPSQPSPQKEQTPGIDALAQTALPDTVAPGEGELEFSFASDEDSFRSQQSSDVSTVDRGPPGPTRPALPPAPVSPPIMDGLIDDHEEQDSFISSVGSYDGDSVFSLSMDRPRSRFTAAHLLLLVAIVVFLVAVGLLIRRLVLQSRRSRSSVQRVVDASRPTATPLADATRPAGKPMDAGKQPAAKVPPSGSHLNKLLHPALQPGTIAVKSNPAGMVYINGRRVGSTPKTTTVPPGDRVRLAIVASRHKIHRQTVDIPLSRGISLDITLQAAGYNRADGRRIGWLSVYCGRRDNRHILLDGEDTGYTCPKPVTFRLRPGRHTVGFYSIKTDKTSTRHAKVRWGRRTRAWATR